MPILVLAIVPLSAFGHSEIIFPKVFSVADLPSTGFVLLNPDRVVATVNFYLFSPGGSVVSASAPIRIGGGGQTAKLGNELFPNATIGGWVYVITDSEGMQAFWLNYD